MVKITGDQSIPSELLDLYRGTLTEKQPDGTSRKRFPYRLKNMQEGGSGVSTKQRTQRQRFLGARNRFLNISPAERARWYAARPPWSSFLWYYNYFIMSDLMGNANINEGGAGVINSIRYYEATAPSGSPSPITVAISEVDPNKAVVMLYGNGTWEAVEGAVVPIYPYPVTMHATYCVLKMSGTIDVNAGIGALVIEYI